MKQLIFDILHIILGVLGCAGWIYNLHVIHRVDKSHQEIREILAFFFRGISVVDKLDKKNDI